MRYQQRATTPIAMPVILMMGVGRTRTRSSGGAGPSRTGLGSHLDWGVELSEWCLPFADLHLFLLLVYSDMLYLIRTAKGCNISLGT